MFSTDHKNVAANANVSASDTLNIGRWHTQNLVDGKTSRKILASGSPLEEFSKNLNRFVTARTKLVNLQQQLVRIKERYSPDTRQKLESLQANLKSIKRKRENLLRSPVAFSIATDFKQQGQFVATKGKPRAIYLLHRGDEKSPDKKKGPIAPAAISAMDQLRHHFKLKPDHREGARRIALANWIVDKDNPLTWRSIVNRTWQHHFGTGLVATSNDFGRMGSKPTHPELLDYLAAEFRNNGQSLKKLHRLIVTSKTYRQSSQYNPEMAALDSSNRFFWRMNRRRLDAEQVRDSILHVVGKLNPKMYGPGYQAFALKDDHSPHYNYLKYDPKDSETHRRSIYRFIVRSSPDPFFQALDCADPSQIVDRRNETNTALQALAMMNNRFITTMSTLMAKQLEGSDLATMDHKVDRIFCRILGRKPTNRELKLLAGIARKHSLENVCRLLFNTNEFMFVD